MYKLIGADQKEYGPVSSDQLRQWIAENRATRQTLVEAEGATEWCPLGSLPEFALAFPAQAGPVSALAGGPMQPKNSGLAVSSLVLGILGVITCGLTALPGLILGIVAQNKIKKSEGRLAGSGLAVAGIIVSGIFLVMIPIFAVMLIPAAAQLKEGGRSIKCASNLMQLSAALKMYAIEHEDRLPSSGTWCDAIQRSVFSTNVFQCPTEPNLRCAYAFNANLGGRKQSEINPRTVLLFESDAGWNGAGDADEVVAHKHSKKAVHVVFVDGTTRSISRARLRTLRWEP